MDVNITERLFAETTGPFTYRIIESWFVNVNWNKLKFKQCDTLIIAFFSCSHSKVEKNAKHFLCKVYRLQ